MVTGREGIHKKLIKGRGTVVMERLGTDYGMSVGEKKNKKKTEEMGDIRYKYQRDDWRRGDIYVTNTASTTHLHAEVSEMS